MSNILVVLENDHFLSEERHGSTMRFMNQYKGEKIILTGLMQRSKEEIYKAVKRCTDIVCQTVFVDQSIDGLIMMANLLATIKQGKNVYISATDIKENFVRHLTQEEIYNIRHHAVYDIFGTWDISEAKEIDFCDIALLYEEEKKRKEEEEKRIKEYTDSARERKTGLKIKLLCCIANGPQFKNLPIGEIIEVLDMSETDPRPERGLWIWGNGEPIKLVNDNDVQEYELAGEITAEVALDEIERSIYAVKLENYSRNQLMGFIAAIKDVQIGEDSPIAIANFLCEEMQIEKRRNRQLIVNILEKLKKNEPIGSQKP